MSIPFMINYAIALGRLSPSHPWKVIKLLPWISPGEKKNIVTLNNLIYI